MKKNWKTTIAGILTAIVAIGSAAIGLLFAEDGKK